MFLIGLHLQQSFNCTIDILKWQYMKNLPLPLAAPLQPEDSVLSILKSSESPLLKHLTLEHLADLVASSAVARNEIFALKELGGNAPCWQEIYVLCVTVLRRFISCTHWMNSFRLRKNNPDLSHLRSYGPLPEIKLPNKFRNSTPIDIRRTNAQVNLASIKKPTEDRFWSRGIKASIRLSLLDAEIPLASTAELFTTGGADIDHMPWASSSAAAKPLLGLNSGQAVIWATEILACLTLASYTEDAYGSVQRSLGQILSLFAEALEVVERQLQLVGLMHHSLVHVDDDLEDGKVDLPTMAKEEGMAVASSSTHDLGVTNGSNRRSRTMPTDLRSCKYYRFASDPTLPWRLHATLSWAVSKCLSQFGAHLESMQLDRRSLGKLQSMKKSLSVIKNGMYNSAV